MITTKNYIQNRRERSKSILEAIAVSRICPPTPEGIDKAIRAQELIIAARAAQFRGQHLPEVHNLELRFLARMLTGYMPESESGAA